MDTDTNNNPNANTESTSEQAQNENVKSTAKRKRNMVFNAISLSLIAIAIAWGLNLFLLYNKYVITNNATIEQYISPINSRVTGYIKEVRFTEHQWVDAGDTLLIIADRSLSKFVFVDVFAWGCNARFVCGICYLWNLRFATETDAL
ncbi:MAG: hypothetical protein BWZ06_00059 [Bacteroidetes bacterium ADurb.BinA261]|jgi:membrane fusion protein (multidrug efflux system)|nr:MAG: hypothetical protein BWZ06_00059 [Bacteroidetes bacterium ADurb.BinA261]